MRKLGLGAWLSIALLGAMLVLALYFSFTGWGSPDEREIAMSGVGWTAMILGSLVTLLVGGGLVALMIYSNRSGHDR